ncbi:hypothetical protein ACK3F5_03660 [Photorhabdus asymbiotica UENP]
MTGVSECSQQRGNLKDNGYRMISQSYSSLPHQKSVILTLINTVRCYRFK